MTRKELLQIEAQHRRSSAGGKSKSPAKQAAVRANLMKARMAKSATLQGFNGSRRIPIEWRAS